MQKSYKIFFPIVVLKKRLSRYAEMVKKITSVLKCDKRLSICVEMLKNILLGKVFLRNQLWQKMRIDSILSSVVEFTVNDMAFSSITASPHY